MSYLSAQGRDLVIWMAVFTPLTLASVAMRLYVIFKVNRRNLQLDDILVVFSTAGLLAFEGATFWGSLPSTTSLEPQSWTSAKVISCSNLQRPWCLVECFTVAPDWNTDQGRALLQPALQICHLTGGDNSISCQATGRGRPRHYSAKFPSTTSTWSSSSVKPSSGCSCGCWSSSRRLESPFSSLSSWLAAVLIGPSGTRSSRKRIASLAPSSILQRSFATYFSI